MKIKAFLTLILLLIITGCRNITSMKIRLKNQTQYDMKNISVNFRGEVIKYGNVSKGEYSNYFTVNRAYRYAYVEWKSENKKRKVQPKDYVGEKELEKGRYTYIIFPKKGQDVYHTIKLEKD